MSQEFTNSNTPYFRSKASSENLGEAEQTLRLVATVEPPVGLADRVHQRLARAQREPIRRGVWQSLMPMRRVQYAGAAALALAVAGSMWGAYHRHDALVQPKVIVEGTNPGSQGVSNEPQGTSSGAFKSAGTERRPATLTPIRVPDAKTALIQKKKPSASRVKPVAKTTAQTSNSTPLVP